jgi:hypothetical protein
VLGLLAPLLTIRPIVVIQEQLAQPALALLVMTHWQVWLMEVRRTFTVLEHHAAMWWLMTMQPAADANVMPTPARRRRMS